jgi:hypothetical protein
MSREGSDEKDEISGEPDQLLVSRHDRAAPTHTSRSLK